MLRKPTLYLVALTLLWPATQRSNAAPQQQIPVPQTRAPQQGPGLQPEQQEVPARPQFPSQQQMAVQQAPGGGGQAQQQQTPGERAPEQGAQQTPVQAGGAPQKQAKDREEADLFNSILKETNPAKKLQLLDQWTQKYPDTAFKEERLKFYMQAYQQANQLSKAVDAANELLKLDPNDFSAHYTIASLTPFLGSTDPNVWANGEKSANAILENLEKQFAPDKKPANVSQADWEAAKKAALIVAHQALGWVNMMQKKNEVAEQEFIKTLELNPQAAQVSYWLGTCVLAEKNPDKNTLALFSFARAAAYDGPGALPPAGRQQVDAYLTKVYKNYHGDDPKGLADLKALAKAQPLPPPDFKIKTIEEVNAEKEAELAKTNPLLATFLKIKEGLTGPDGANFWNEMKGKAMPELRGTVVSAKPSVKPKVVELAMSQSQTPEITIIAPETPARCKLDPGDTIDFSGSEAKEFTANPFMIKMEGGKITSGCKQAPAPAKRAPAKKSASKKAAAR
jgi:tetratricopeptide (TPR) repeat protein